MNETQKSEPILNSLFQVFFSFPLFRNPPFAKAHKKLFKIIKEQGQVGQ